MRGTEARDVKQRINKKLNMQTSNQTNLLVAGFAVLRVRPDPVPAKECCH